MPRSPLEQFVDPAAAYADPADDEGSLGALSRIAVMASRPARPAPALRRTELSPDEEREFQEWMP